MAVKSSVQPLFSGEQIEPEYTPQGIFYYCHDTVVGRLVLARSLADQRGAYVYSVDNFEGEVEKITNQQLDEFTQPEKMHRHLLPWFSVILPTHLDTGEPAALDLQHVPDVIAVLRMSPTSFDV